MFTLPCAPGAKTTILYLTPKEKAIPRDFVYIYCCQEASVRNMCDIKEHVFDRQDSLFSSLTSNGSYMLDSLVGNDLDILLCNVFSLAYKRRLPTG